MTEDYFVHPTATLEDGASLGKGTKVWHYAHVRTGAVLGEDCVIGKSSFIDHSVHIGDRVKIQNLVSVYYGVTIDNDVFVGPHAVFTNDFRPRAQPADGWNVVKTHVHEGVSIGANSTIVCGHDLGKFCMIGAGSVVTKDVPEFALVYGNPAKVRGWVCKCGEKLDVKLHRSEPETITCPHCSAEITLPSFEK